MFRSAVCSVFHRKAEKNKKNGIPPFFLFLDRWVLLVAGEGDQIQRHSTVRIHRAFLEVKIEGILALRSLNHPRRMMPNNFCFVRTIGFTGVQIIEFAFHTVDT